MMKKFGKIEGLRHIVKAVEGTMNYHGLDYFPVISYQGTVKMHGTNASVCRMADGTILVQSRNQSFPLTADQPTDGWQSGWAKFVRERLDTFLSFMPSTDVNVTIFGEWIGEGIQKGVAVSELSKRFVAFELAIWQDEERTVRWPVDAIFAPEEGIYSVKDFPTYSVTIDYQNPREALEYINAVTLEVEKECPVGKAFGVSGLGEGIVWVPVAVDQDSNIWMQKAYGFKSKGEKHQEVKTPKKPKVMGEEATAFVDAVLTEVRLQKGIDWLNEMGYEISRKSTGHILKWLNADILEEESDLMEEMGADKKEVGKLVGNKGRNMFFHYLRTEI